MIVIVFKLLKLFNIVFYICQCNFRFVSNKKKYEITIILITIWSRHCLRSVGAHSKWGQVYKVLSKWDATKAKSHKMQCVITLLADYNFLLIGRVDHNWKKLNGQNKRQRRDSEAKTELQILLIMFIMQGNLGHFLKW